MKFVLFPMMHVASPTFYTQVRSRLKTCDVIVVEGIKGNSAEVSALTMAYRFAPRRRRNGLVEQRDQKILPPGVTVVYPDVTSAEAVGELRKLPRWTRLMLVVFAPVMGIVFAIRGPRAFLSEDLVVEDLPTTRRAESMADHPIEHALLDRRDKQLLVALGEIHAERSLEPITVAVLYGAGHMPAVVAGLMDGYGYRPRDAEWLTVCIPD